MHDRAGKGLEAPPTPALICGNSRALGERFPLGGQLGPPRPFRSARIADGKLPVAGASVTHPLTLPFTDRLNGAVVGGMAAIPKLTALIISRPLIDAGRLNHRQDASSDRRR